MRIALVTPSDTACTSNAGAHMITAGIRYIVRQAVPGAYFVNVDMLRDDDHQWAAARECDAMLLCGNPRFSVSADDAWWEDGIWKRIEFAMDAGVRVVDAWAGACVGLDVDTDVQAQSEHLLAIPRTHRALQAAYRLTGAIARDRLTFQLYQAHGIRNVHYLPCSSWFARWDYNFFDEDQLPMLNAAIVLLALRGHDWAPDALRRLAVQLADRHGTPCPFIATRWDDYEWATEIGLDRVILVTDPASLLRLYAQVVRLVSLRVHASVPAASVYAHVCTLAIDSRAQICDPFGLPVQPFTDLQSPDFVPRFGVAYRPKLEPIALTMRSLLTC